MTKVEDVFGVSVKQVKSYIVREQVDNKFTEALKSDKQIIVYGSSKQGKSALVKKYIDYDENIVISLSPKHTLKDIYQTILRKSGVTLRTSYTKGSGQSSTVKGKARIQGAIALVLKGTAEVGLDKSTNQSSTENYEEIEFNLELPDDVADIINRHGNKKVVILENFHYLSEEVQKDFAYDLRTFQELKVRFIIVGVWKESNRLSQFNGELQDRIDEIPVEPWTDDDFLRIIAKGEQELNIQFATTIKQLCLDNSFSSVGVFQELLRLTCINSEVFNKGENIFIDSEDSFNKALVEKTHDYSERHLKNLEAIASGNNTQIQKDKPLPFFMHYYIVTDILAQGYDAIKNGGMSKLCMMHSIKQKHHRANDLKGGHLTTALKGLVELQSNKSINPPVIAYDATSKKIKVVDSTFYFFLKNADLDDVIDEITNPIEALELI
ncbi:AAA family ATPase [Shewanella sp. 38A_GOM-205m]|uniref:AAA family ATPase n=1 Tax=Shewanella sp. 38A_GOM-205m TaxID=1380363 RepID=UPI00048B7857|nr:AAA family ATPase [Shewanella sp. 38A_GOM-205m]